MYVIIFIIFLIVLVKLFIFTSAIYRTQDIILDSETKEIKYLIISEYNSKNAFVPNEEVIAKISIISLREEDFKNIQNGVIFVGEGITFANEGKKLFYRESNGNSGDVYAFPLDKAPYGILKNPEFKRGQIILSDDYKELNVEISIQFSRPGEYKNNIMLYYSDDSNLFLESKKTILIEPYSNWAQIENLKLAAFGVIITLLTLILTLNYKK